MDLFLLKKIIGFLVMPLSLISLLLIMALILFYKRPSLSFKCLLSASFLLILLSTGFVSDRLMHPIENNFVSYQYTEKPVDYIVILGCGNTSNPDLPATSQLLPCSLQRLVEALRIFKLHPEAELITSGAAFDNNDSNATNVKKAAMLLGVPERKIIVESFPKDTQEEAELIGQRVKGKHVVLVTNADHMLRAVNYFNQQGVEVTPAPASHWVKNIDSYKNWSYYLPKSHNLTQSTNAWYESIGLLFQWLKS